MLDAYEKLWIHFFFQYKFHQEKSLLKVFVSVIIIIIFKSKIEDSFIFITIFLCKLHHIVKKYTSFSICSLKEQKRAHIYNVTTVCNVTTK